MTDFRALCAELVDAIGSLVGGVQCGHYNQRDMWKCREIFNRAYAALAQPEPQGSGPDDVTQLYYKHGGGDGMYGGMGEVNFEEAVEEALARWGRSAIELEGKQ